MDGLLKQLGLPSETGSKDETFVLLQGINLSRANSPQSKSTTAIQAKYRGTNRGLDTSRRALAGIDLNDQSHGAEASTSFYTIIETARANGVSSRCITSSSCSTASSDSGTPGFVGRLMIFMSYPTPTATVR